MNSQTGKQLGWKWFKFIIYAQLFLPGHIMVEEAKERHWFMDCLKI